MASPADSNSIATSVNRTGAARGALASVLAVVLAGTSVSAFAQDKTVDPALRDLIPDAAVADPEGWAKGGVPAAPDTPVEDVQPQSPLAELPELTLPWPDEELDLPALVSLDADPTAEEALAAQDVLLGDLPGPLPAGEESRLGDRVVLVFPPSLDAFPERAEFSERFSDLSTLVMLGEDSDDNIAQIAVRARTDREMLQRLLRIYGYYDADVVQTVAGVRPGTEASAKEVTVRFDIAPGPRYRFGAIALGNLEATGTDFPYLRANFGIWPRDPLSSDAIVRGVADLGVALGETGYAFAKVGEPDLLVDHRREEGDLTVPVDTGGKYRFGAISSELPRFLPAWHLHEIARFRSGDLFRQSEVEDLRRAVIATGLVASVTVTPRETLAPQGGQPGEVALDVGMAPAPLRTVAGAIGYDSGDGFRLEGSWEHRNLFPPEGMLRVRGIAGTREQLAGVTFRRNNFKGRDQVLTLDLYGNTVSRTAYAARTIAFSATFEKLTTLIFQKPWVWSAGLEVLATSEREGEVNGINTARSTYFIGALPLRGAYDSSNDLLDPTRGFRVALRASPELSVRGGQRSTYARIQADASAYQPLGDKVVLAGRVRLGAIPGAEIVNIAPSRRFFAGGGGSVRGYGYQLIGPRNSLGEPSGGRSLYEFSLEARVKTGLFDGALSVVPFFDAGGVDVDPVPRLRDMRYGAGIGVRYNTGFGPLRLDIGTPINPRPGDSRIAVYIALGQAF